MVSKTDAHTFDLAILWKRSWLPLEMLKLIKDALLLDLPYFVVLTLPIGKSSCRSLLRTMTISFGRLSPRVTSYLLWRNEAKLFQRQINIHSWIHWKSSQNYRALNILFCGLDSNEFNRVTTCDTAKDVWDTFKITYRGTSQLRESNINPYVHLYELVKMFPLNPSRTCICALLR